ncbi:MAG: PQQ-binding-like beta-propeller repeat protein [bacterium]
MSRPISKPTILLLLIFLLSVCVQADENSSSDWPAWGGPNREFSVSPGVITPGRPFELKVVWKKALGSGYSAVSVVDDLAVTMFSDSTFDYVIALNANDGTELWRFKIGSTFPGRWGSANGPISTPLLTADKLIALSAAGRLFALDLKSGELIWETDLVKDHQSIIPFYGFATSPLIYNNIMLVETGGSNGNALSAFDPNTGQVLWTANSDTVDYQSPSLLETSNGAQFVAITNRGLYGVQPATGKVLWRFEHGGGTHPMGAASGNLVPVGGNRFFLKNKEQGGILMSLEYANEMYHAEEVWQTRDIKSSYIVPVYHNGHLFGYNSRIFSCVDVETGKRVWRSRQPGDGLPIVVDGHLVVITKNGKLSVAPAKSDGYKELASLNLFDDLVWAPASFANGKLFLRSMAEIASVDIVAGESRKITDQPIAGKIPGSKFALFVETVEQAKNKKALVDTFMANQKELPVIEGDDLVHFIYRGEANDMALVGDLVGWRYDWPMHRIEGTNLFYYSSHLEPDARLTYKFIKDLQFPMVDPLNTRTIRSMFFGPASWFSMPEWSMPEYLNQATATKTGRIDSLRFKSALTQINKIIEVYLPAGYEQSKQAYPVAYVHEGRTARALGQMIVTLDNLIGERIKPVPLKIRRFSVK